jgi:carbonic anhydrase
MRLPAILLIIPLALIACSDRQQAENAHNDEHEADHAPTWSYAGDTGPAHWGQLGDANATCGSGKQQSPINVPAGLNQDAALAALSFEFGASNLHIADTGHGIQAIPDDPQSIAIGADRYGLLQFHVHTPSEHTLAGRSFPMEVHFVHQATDGGLAVVGLLIEEGGQNGAFQPVVDAFSAAEGTISLESLAALLPSDKAYFTYPGSLTTPACTEGLRWILLKAPVSLSAEQISVFAGDHGPTNRPVQPLNGRTVRASE